MSDTIKKNAKAVLNNYSYEYVTLAEVHRYMAEIGITYAQEIGSLEGTDYIWTNYTFPDGSTKMMQGARVIYLMDDKNPIQAMGKAITYARRYSILMNLGLATEDDDANGIERRTETSPISFSPVMASDKQIYVIKKAFTGDKLNDLLARFGVSKAEELTSSDASMIIKRIKEQER